MLALPGSPRGRESLPSRVLAGDVHGVEGVDIEDVEAATSIHQHLGEALLADNGVDDDHVAVGSRWRLEEGE